MVGFAAITLVRPKTKANVGGALRAAACYGAMQVNLCGARTKWMQMGANTTQSHRFIPTFVTDDPLSPRPHSCEVVVVELLDGAVPLPEFQHPARALYVFGPEDGTLGRAVTERAQHVIKVPTAFCMNLAATVNVVLYDRIAKRGWGSDRIRRAA